jgi:hypothetical protein
MRGQASAKAREQGELPRAKSGQVRAGKLRQDERARFGRVHASKRKAMRARSGEVTVSQQVRGQAPAGTNPMRSLREDGN